MKSEVVTVHDNRKKIIKFANTVTKSRRSPENSHIPDALKDGSDSPGRAMTQLKYCMALLPSINQEIKADSSSCLETKVVTETGLL